VQLGLGQLDLKVFKEFKEIKVFKEFKEIQVLKAL
jgi:hypothetical protein